jgi:DNA polymerase-3 subunit chi
VAALDKSLWEAPEPDWLPHGTPRDGDPDLQPVWLAADDTAPNNARFLFLVEGAVSPRLAEFDRVFDLFDGNDPEAIAAARDRWRAAKDGGHTLTYWQQGQRGWEQRSAASSTSQGHAMTRIDAAAGSDRSDQASHRTVEETTSE